MAKQSFTRLKGIVLGAKPGAEAEMPSPESELTWLEQVAHFCVHVGESFVRNRCLVRASALSFSTLLALIPMLAVAIGVTSSLLKSQGEDQIYSVINKAVAYIVPPAEIQEGTTAVIATNAAPDLLTGLPNTGLPETTSNQFAGMLTNSLAGPNGVAAVTVTNEDERVVSAQRQAARSIHQFVQNMGSAKLGMVGMLLLVWVAISMLANIEATFNDIWGVTRGRPWLRRIVLYWFTLTLGPMALVGAYSIIALHMSAAQQVINEMPFVGELFFQALPVAILWLVFSFVYVTVPNTKVRWRAAVVGGLVAALLWHLNNLLGYLYVSRFVTNNMIYGSLGLVPVFMAGLYLTWVILLLGVQVSYAWQNRASYLQDKLAENVNQRGREFIALRLMTCLGMRYRTGQPPATLDQLAGDLGISSRLTQQVLQTLLAARLITEVAGTEVAYCPARPLDTINAHQVLLAVRSVNKPVVFTREEPVRDEIYGEFARIEEAERVAAAAVTLEALVNRARAKLAAPEIGPSATARTLPECVPVELTVVPETDEMTGNLKPTELEPATPTEPLKAQEPEKPARKIAVPEDNYDFPL